MNRGKYTYNQILPNRLQHKVTPPKQTTLSIQFQEPMNDTMKPIYSSRGFSSMADDIYINEINSPKQVEIGTDKEQNNEEIIVNNQVHEKIIDQNCHIESQLNQLLHSTDINQLDFITTLLRLKSLKSTHIPQKTEDESKSYIKELLDICENKTPKNQNMHEHAFSNNIIGNCNIDSFLTDITPRKQGFEPQAFSAEKKGLTMKDLIDITNRRKQKMNNNQTKKTDIIGDKKPNEVLLQSRTKESKIVLNDNAINNKSNDITKTNHRKNSAEIRYESNTNDHYNFPTKSNSKYRESNDTKKIGLSLSRGDIRINDDVHIPSISDFNARNYEHYEMNDSSFLIENNVSVDTINKSAHPSFIKHKFNNQESFNKSSNIIDSNYFPIEENSLTSNMLLNKNQSDLCNTGPMSKPSMIYHDQQIKQSTKIPNQLIKPPLHPPVPLESPHNIKPYSYGALNLEINNRFYFPNEKSQSIQQYSRPIIKQIERTSIVDYVNYGSNPLANIQAEPQRVIDYNDSSSHVMGFDPDTTGNDDFQIQTADIPPSPFPKNSVMFSMEQSAHQNNLANNYRTNLSVGAMSIDDENDLSQVNEYDIDKHQNQNESKEMKFSQMNIDSTHSHPNISSINFSKLTNFVDVQSKKGYTPKSNNIQASNTKASDEKKDLVVAEIDLFAEDNDEDEQEEENQKKVVNKNSISIQRGYSPYTQELNKKLRYFDDASSHKDHRSCKHSIVESIKESKIEFDVDDLIKPSYMLKSNFESPQTNPFRKNLSKSFCGIDQSQPSIITTSGVNVTRKKGRKMSSCERNEIDISSIHNIHKEELQASTKVNPIRIHKKPKGSSEATKTVPNSNSKQVTTKKKFKFKPKRKETPIIEKVKKNNSLLESSSMINESNKKQICQDNRRRDEDLNNKSQIKLNQSRQGVKDNILQNNLSKDIKEQRPINYSSMEYQIHHSFSSIEPNNLPNEVPNIIAKQYSLLIKDNPIITNIQRGIIPNKQQLYISQSAMVSHEPQLVKDKPNQLITPTNSQFHKYDLDKFSIEVQNTNSSKKSDYSTCMNDLVADSLKLQRQNQEKSRKKIADSLSQIVLSQEKNEKEIKDKIDNGDLNDSEFMQSATSLAVKLECEKELNQVRLFHFYSI